MRWRQQLSSFETSTPIGVLADARGGSIWRQKLRHLLVPCPSTASHELEQSALRVEGRTQWRGMLCNGAGARPYRRLKVRRRIPPPCLPCRRSPVSGTHCCFSARTSAALGASRCERVDKEKAKIDTPGGGGGGELSVGLTAGGLVICVGSRVVVALRRFLRSVPQGV